MSKTLAEYLEEKDEALEEKFKTLAKFCGAKDTAARHLRMVADFPDLPYKPRFLLVLKKKTAGGLDDNWIVTNIAISTSNLGNPETYLNPEKVLYDLGKVFPEDGTNNWEVHNPADIDSLLRKYAWLARIEEKPELFGKLLQYH